MRLEELVGQRIRTRREGLALTQDQLGRQLGDSLGRRWSRQAVSAAEKGERAFTAAELVAIAGALQISVGSLFVPPAGVDEIELPNGAMLTRNELVDAVLPTLGTEGTFVEMQRILGRLNETFTLIRRSVDVVATDVQLLNDGLLLALKLHSLAEDIPADVRLSADGEGES